MGEEEPGDDAVLNSIRMQRKGRLTERSTKRVHLNAAPKGIQSECIAMGVHLNAEQQAFLRMQQKSWSSECRAEGVQKEQYLHACIFTDADDSILVRVDDSPAVGLSPPHHLREERLFLVHWIPQFGEAQTMIQRKLLSDCIPSKRDSVVKQIR